MAKLLGLLLITGCTTCQPLYTEQDIQEKEEYIYMECKKATFSEEYCQELIRIKDKNYRAENSEHCPERK